MTRLVDLPVTFADGSTGDLSGHAGQVLLIVNVASKCGFTPQYAGLQALQERFAARGFSVLAFPCNQFGAQEPGNAAEIASFCSLAYGVSFAIFGKIDVNGEGAAPLFRHLKAHAPGVLGSKAIKWNFTKFLVDRAGNVTKRYASRVEPAELALDIEACLT